MKKRKVKIVLCKRNNEEYVRILEHETLESHPQIRRTVEDETWKVLTIIEQGPEIVYDLYVFEENEEWLFKGRFEVINSKVDIRLIEKVSILSSNHIEFGIQKIFLALEQRQAQAKLLRDQTGAGLIDCKYALEQNNCDMEKAHRWLIKKGLSNKIDKAFDRDYK